MIVVSSEVWTVSAAFNPGCTLKSPREFLRRPSAWGPLRITSARPRVGALAPTTFSVRHRAIMQSRQDPLGQPVPRTSSFKIHQGGTTDLVFDLHLCLGSGLEGALGMCCGVSALGRRRCLLQVSGPQWSMGAWRGGANNYHSVVPVVNLVPVLPKILCWLPPAIRMRPTVLTLVCSLWALSA